MRNPETHEAVISAAIEILREQGPAAASIDAIARRAGASKPTLYRWWPTKADLLVEVYEHLVAALPAPPDTGTVERDLIEVRRQMWRVWRETVAGRAFVALVAEAQVRPEAATTLNERMLPSRRAGTLEILQRGVERGEIDSKADLQLLIDASHGFDWYRLLTGRIDDEPEVIAASVRTQLDGFLHTH
ncbi:TetR/AcrR family transcriptional regulator [Streptomyces sp. NPDC091217]|uniref:TetR/AcrR family transcriptional regulator n=1 Tax=Streptomyces sp. NPDC091217 TaxID=3365975 RepID=UPI0037F91318